MNNNCELCGNLFVLGHPKKRFCSEKCRKQAERKRYRSKEIGKEKNRSYQCKHYLKNKEKGVYRYIKKGYADRPNRKYKSVKERRAAACKKDVSLLRDRYIKGILRLSGIKKPTQEIIELKKIHLTLKRITK
jgi:hypothetical protein